MKSGSAEMQRLGKLNPLNRMFVKRVKNDKRKRRIK